MTLNNTIGQIPSIEKGFGHSVGLKLLLVCFLVLLMGVPTLFIAAISFERAGRADDVTREVSQRYGGAQTLLGPVLHIPYGVKDKYGEFSAYRDYVIFPETGTVDIKDLETTIRKLSLFKVPTYQANAHFTAKFVLPDRNVLEASGKFFFWEDALVTIGLSDVRGLRDDVYLVSEVGKKRKFGPRGSLSTGKYHTTTTVDRNSGRTIVNKFQPYGQFINIQSMNVKVGDLLEGKSELSISAALKVNGTDNLSIAPFAQTTKVSMKADWPHPGFQGNYPPLSHEITDSGFVAKWAVPYLARGMAASGEAGELNLQALSSQAVSVKFVNPVNPYQNVNRALKYAVLFIGMVFLAYFLFETLVGIKVHAAQYVLVGLAQSVFYLLLLAFAEHIGFTLAFMFAAGATVFITSAYAGVVFGKTYTLKAGAVFATTYGLLYVLLRIEDFALMVGALASFLAIATTMYLTRNINWYGNSANRDVA